MHADESRPLARNDALHVLHLPGDDPYLATLIYSVHASTPPFLDGRVAAMDKRTMTRFAHRLVKTRLLDAQQVAAAQSVAGDDEEALTRHLIGQGVLARFQGR